MKYIAVRLSRWKVATLELKFVIFLSISIMLNFCVVTISPYFLNYIQNREGVRVNDFILTLLPSYDVSYLIWGIMNLSLLIAVGWLVFKPKDFAIATMTWAVVVIMRYFFIYMFSLEAPEGYVKLTDPILDQFVYAGKVINKDLFFSGHTSVMFLAYLSVQHPVLKKIFFVATCLVGFLLMIQHNHYTFDIVAAPFFTWIGYKFSTVLYFKQMSIK